VERAPPMGRRRLGTATGQGLLTFCHLFSRIYPALSAFSLSFGCSADISKIEMQTENVHCSLCFYFGADVSGMGPMRINITNPTGR
jgi:hypothetical protein